MLNRFSRQTVSLRLILDAGRDNHQIRAILMLPHDTLMAEVSGQILDQDLDILVDKLAVAICQYKDSIRQSDLLRRKDRREQEFSTIKPWLDSDQRSTDQASFMSLLRPMIRRMRSLAWHELINAQLQGQIPPGQVTLADILDEVIVQAWENYEQRSGEESLDQWLLQLVHQVVDRQVLDRPASMSLYTELDKSDPRYLTDMDWVEDNEPAWQPELVTFDDILPDHEIREPWQTLAEDEQKQWISGQLSTLRRGQRRAFILFAMEGLNASEIARLQKRPQKEVEEDIQKTREYLKKDIIKQVLVDG